MGRVTRMLAACAASGALLWPVVDVAAAPSFVIRASSTLMRLGGYRIENDATYADALAALGPASSCRLAKNRFLGVDRGHAFATWSRVGVTIELITYGYVPRGKTACTASRVIHIHTVRASDRRWRTARGLRIGDPVSRLRRLYRSAKAARALPGWYAAGYWLITRRVGGYEGIGGLRPTAPVLVAEAVGGRVSAFVFVVDAEGD